MSLTPQQERFVQEYLLDLNATQAVMRSGYSTDYDSACSQATRLLANAEVASAIAAAKAQLARKNEGMAQRVIDELALVGFSRITHYIDPDTLQFRKSADVPPETWAAISSIKVRREVSKDTPPTDVIELKLWDKVKALTKLGEHLGILSPKEAAGITFNGDLNITVQQLIALHEKHQAMIAEAGERKGEADGH